MCVKVGINRVLRQHKINEPKTQDVYEQIQNARIASRVPLEVVYVLTKPIRPKKAVNPKGYKCKNDRQRKKTQ